MLYQGFFIISIIIGIFLLRYLKLIYKFIMYQKKMIEFAKNLPGIPALPFIGNLIFLFKNKKNLPIAFDNIARQLKKNFGIWYGPILTVIIIDPRDIEIILTSPSINNKEPILYNIMAKYLGPSSILTAPVTNKFRNDKKLLMSIVNGKYVFKFIDTFNYHAKVLVQLLDNKVDKMEFDVLNNMSDCIGDILFETIFGIPGKMQHGSEDKFIAVMERLTHLGFDRIVNLWEHSDFLYKLLNNKNSKIWHSFKTMTNLYIEKLIAEKKKKYSKVEVGEIDSEFNFSLFDQLFSRVEETQEWTEEEMKTHFLTLFATGFDTLHGLISFTFLMIAMHQEVQNKIRDEVNEVVADDLIDENILNNLKYTDMTLKEIIRLFPIAPFMGRVTNDDLKLTSYTLPKRCSVVVFTYGVHRDPNYWIEPDKFNPERFTSENSKNRPKYAYIPFSGGVRICPAYKYGIVCLKIIIAHIIRNYELSTTMKMSDLDLYMDISVRNRTGYPISFKKLKL